MPELRVLAQVCFHSTRNTYQRQRIPLLQRHQLRDKDSADLERRIETLVLRAARARLSRPGAGDQGVPGNDEALEALDALGELKEDRKVYEQIRVFGLEPLFYANWMDAGCRGVAGLMAMCRESWRNAVTADMVREVLLKKIGRIMKGKGMYYIPLKGCDMRVRVYGRPEARTMCDLDLMVKKEEHSIVEQILAKELSAQKTPWKTHSGRWESSYYNSHLLIPVSGHMISLELHRAFGHRWHVTPDYEELWRRAEYLGEPGVKMLSYEDVLLLAVYHLSRSLPAMNVKWLVDLQGIVVHLKPDWNILIERSGLWGCRTALWFFLQRAQKTLCEDFVPGWVMKEVQPGEPRRTYLDSILPDRLKGPPMERFPTRLFQCLTLFPFMDDWNRRSRFLVHYSGIRFMDLLGF